MSVLTGTAVVEVDVPPGTPMAGYAARRSASTAVHDPLAIRALWLDRLCWITVDVCGLHEDTCAEIARRVGADPALVRVSATHTHSGPCLTPGRLGGDVPELRAAVVQAAVRAAGSAASDRRPARPQTVRAAVDGVAHDRRRDRPLTIDVQGLLLRDEAGAVVAALVTFPCHPVVLDATSTAISGDYPAVVRRRLEQAWPGAVVLFATGCAGDVNTGHPAGGPVRASDPRRTFAEAERIGAVLADRVLTAVPGDLPGPRGVTSHRTRQRLDLTTLEEPSPAELADRWRDELATAGPDRAALLTAWIDWADRLAAAPEPPTAWEAVVSLDRVDGCWLVGLPGEPFLAVAEHLRAVLGSSTLVLGYTHGCPGYLPTATAYDTGGYEVREAHRYYGMPAPFAAGSAERLTRTVLQLAAHQTTTEPGEPLGADG